MRSLHLILAISLTALSVGCLAPKDRRPGLRLPGEVAAYPSDWSIVDDHPLISVEVRTPYLLRHSVTITRGVYDGELVIGARDPETKSWPGWVDDDPRVRLGVGESVYEAKLVPITDPAEKARVLGQAAAQAGAPPDLKRIPIRFWRVRPRD